MNLLRKTTADWLVALARLGGLEAGSLGFLLYRKDIHCEGRQATLYASGLALEYVHGGWAGGVTTWAGSLSRDRHRYTEPYKTRPDV